MKLQTIVTVILLGMLSAGFYYICFPAMINVLIVITTVFTRYIRKQFQLFCEETNRNQKKRKLRVQWRIPPSVQIPDVITVYHARIMAPNSDTPFLNACFNGDTELIKELIKTDANIYEENNFGEGAMYLATYHLVLRPKQTDASSIWSLYYAGCPVNIKTREGFTPLHLAAFYGHRALIKWLLAKGADRNIQPFPAAIAWKQGHKEAAALLSPLYNNCICSKKINN